MQGIHGIEKESPQKWTLLYVTGDVLLSRAASRQVSSALQSLTTVFGMGTGVTSASLSPNMLLSEIYFAISKLNNA